MKIKDVLADKGRRLVSVHPSRRVAELPAIFNDNSISSVAVVGAHSKLLGIVTDRLFIQELALRGPQMLSLTAGDIMLTPPPTCSVDDSVSTALRTMTEDRVRHLIVIDENAQPKQNGSRIAGIVSIGDLVKFRMQDADLESRVLRDIALTRLASQLT